MKDSKNQRWGNFAKVALRPQDSRQIYGGCCPGPVEPPPPPQNKTSTGS